MNAHIHPMPVTDARERLAMSFLSLAQTQRRLSHQYRRMAQESERLNRHEAYAHSKAEASRLWADAKWHLDRARMHLGR